MITDYGRGRPFAPFWYSSATGESYPIRGRTLGKRVRLLLVAEVSRAVLHHMPVDARIVAIALHSVRELLLFLLLTRA